MAMSDEKPDDSLIDEIQARYDSARDHASKWREEAREAYRFYAGDQWDADDTAKMVAQQRPIVSFNRIKRLVDAVIGHEANNRAEVRYIPRTMGDAKVNELLTAASQYFRDACDAEFEESDAFRDMIISGMGWTQDRLSDVENPEYNLIEERVDPIEMLWDPSSKKPNLADSRYLFRRKRYTEKEIKNIWPDFDGPFTDSFEDDNDDIAHDSSPRRAYKADGTRSDVKPDVLVLEYQYREREAYYAISMPGNEQSPEATTFEIPADEMDEPLKEKLTERQVQMTVKRRSVVRRCFVIGRHIVQGPDVVCPHDFTYHAITGFRDRERNHWFGIVKMLKDPQRWSNKWLAQIMHILNSNAKGGLMAEEGAVDNRHEFEKTWADPAAVTWFAEGALEKKRVMPKPPPLYPQGVDRLLEYANNSFTDVSGVNQELLGLADREQAGVLEWQRKQSAVTLLAPLFDSLRRFRKMQGRCWLYMMQKYVSDGRIIRITQDGQETNVPFGGDPNVQAQLPPQWKMPETAEFDVIVDQAATAPNQKEQTWAVMTQLLPAIKDMLPPQIMLLLLEYSPMPESLTAKIKDKLKEIESQPKQPDPETMKAQALIEGKKAELQIRQQESQLMLAVEQQKAQMQLEIERQKMDLEREKAGMQMQIEHSKHQQTMALEGQKAQFQAGLQQQQQEHDVFAQQQQLARDDATAQAQGERDDAAAEAKIARENRSAAAKAKRTTQQRATP